MKTDEKTPYIQIEKKAEGKSFAVARQRAEKIKYNFKIEGNQLILDNYLLTDIKNKYRNQEVEIFLYLPEGTYFKPDMTVQNYDHTDDGFFNLWFDSDIYVYKMEASQVKCLNCPPEAGEEVAYGVDAEDMNIGANDSTSTTVTINEKGVQIKEGANAQQNKKVKGLKIDKDGVIIKTN
ncbi:hypothetical protein D9M72_404230 [compost metagenome]